MRKEDLLEEEAIENFFCNGCGCADNCYKHFSESYIRTRRSDMLELTRNDYDGPDTDNDAYGGTDCRQ